MKKRILSVVLTLTLLLSVFSAFSMNAQAASYRSKLKKKGFTEAYLDDLVALHKKYPDWEFEPLVTGMEFDDAVNGERRTHAQQTIQQLKGRDDKYYCSCSKCKKNGKYVACYGGVIAASKWAVAHYMNPLNWLDEQHIFQFEGNYYNKNQSKKGVESILAGSFMSDADITYNNTEGELVTYQNADGKTVKYSKAIMEAAEQYNLSPYLMASRTKKEVGGSKTRVASGVVGTKKPFVGMYNFFSVGAAKTGTQGLEYASGFMKASQSSAIYKKYNAETDKASKKISDIASGQKMCYIGTYGKYYKVRLYNSGYNTDGSVGYVKKAHTTAYTTYGRPWTDPYKAISGAAQFISSAFKYQYTDYLQKFNVNKASGYLHAHEYMTLVTIVAEESVTIYNTYKKIGILNEARTFYIPVYKNISEEDTSAETTTEQQTTQTTTQPTTVKKKPAQVTGVKVTSRGTASVTLQWKKVSGAASYKVYRYNESTKKYTRLTKVTGTSAKLTGLKAGKKYLFAVAAKNSKGTGKKSKKKKAVTKPKRVVMTALTSPGYSLLKADWKKVKGGVSGYQLAYARDKKFNNTVATKDVEKTLKTYTGKNFEQGIKYYVRVRAYVEIDGKRYYGKWAKTRTVKCN